jgi:hypothetical protein
MNMPVVHDEKRPQQELAALAMKKTLDLEVSYNQVSMRRIARQLIQSSVPGFFLSAKPIIDVETA